MRFFLGFIAFLALISGNFIAAAFWGGITWWLHKRHIKRQSDLAITRSNSHRGLHY